MRVVTWNMQGSSYSTEDKWNHGVAPLSARHADVVCLQECGAVPSSAKHLQTLPDGVKTYQWGGTTSRPRHWIGFYPSDPSGNRCNLAVVTNEPPTGYAVVWPPTPPQKRPALAAVVNGALYASLHAISPGGADVPGLLDAVTAQAAGAPWAAAGDFNREPATVHPVAPAVVCAPTAHTHNANDPNPTRTLDYAVRSAAYQGRSERLTLQLSDHYPVLFSSL